MIRKEPLARMLFNKIRDEQKQYSPFDFLHVDTMKLSELRKKMIYPNKKESSFLNSNKHGKVRKIMKSSTPSLSPIRSKSVLVKKSLHSLSNQKVQRQMKNIDIVQLLQGQRKQQQHGSIKNLRGQTAQSSLINTTNAPLSSRKMPINYSPIRKQNQKYNIEEYASIFPSKIPIKNALFLQPHIKSMSGNRQSYQDLFFNQQKVKLKQIRQYSQKKSIIYSDMSSSPVRQQKLIKSSGFKQFEQRVCSKLKQKSFFKSQSNNNDIDVKKFMKIQSFAGQKLPRQIQMNSQRSNVQKKNNISLIEQIDEGHFSSNQQKYISMRPQYDSLYLKQKNESTNSKKGSVKKAQKNQYNQQQDLEQLSDKFQETEQREIINRLITEQIQKQSPKKSHNRSSTVTLFSKLINRPKQFISKVEQYDKLQTKLKRQPFSHVIQKIKSERKKEFEGDQSPRADFLQPITLNYQPSTNTICNNELTCKKLTKTLRQAAPSPLRLRKNLSQNSIFKNMIIKSKGKLEKIDAQTETQDYSQRTVLVNKMRLNQRHFDKNRPLKNVIERVNEQTTTKIPSSYLRKHKYSLQSESQSVMEPESNISKNLIKEKSFLQSWDHSSIDEKYISTKRQSAMSFMKLMDLNDQPFRRNVYKD